MADRNERWVLNHLIEMCRDEELTLRYAADHVKDPSVKTLFVELASRRAQFAADLLPHAQRLGGGEAADHTTRGALHRGRMAIKGALIGYSDREMIAEAEHDEDLALATYENALDDMLPPTARELVERQRAEIRLAHATACWLSCRTNKLLGRSTRRGRCGRARGAHRTDDRRGAPGKEA